MTMIEPVADDPEREFAAHPGCRGVGIKESDNLPEPERSDIETFLSRPHTINYWEVGVSVTLTQRGSAIACIL
jgi:hypothetical protein